VNRKYLLLPASLLMKEEEASEKMHWETVVQVERTKITMTYMKEPVQEEICHNDVVSLDPRMYSFERIEKSKT
jgi:hypothetical protein